MEIDMILSSQARQTGLDFVLLKWLKTIVATYESRIIKITYYNPKSSERYKNIN